MGVPGPNIPTTVPPVPVVPTNGRWCESKLLQRRRRCWPTSRVTVTRIGITTAITIASSVAVPVISVRITSITVTAITVAAFAIAAFAIAAFAIATFAIAAFAIAAFAVTAFAVTWSLLNTTFTSTPSHVLTLVASPASSSEFCMHLADFDVSNVQFAHKMISKTRFVVINRQESPTLLAHAQLGFRVSGTLFLFNPLGFSLRRGTLNAQRFDFAHCLHGGIEVSSFGKLLSLFHEVSH
jgi:hypothetical protein